MERRLSIEGTELVLDDEGAGPALVCLHAIGHDAADFVRLRARFRDRWRVLALDWPGHGRSGPDREPASARRYGTLLDGVLHTLGVVSAVLVGNSIGGAVALAYAARRPDRVRALVLENPGGLAAVDDRLARVALAAMAGFFGQGRRGAWWFPRAFAAYYRIVLQRPAAREARARIVARARTSAPVLEQAWRSFAWPEADLRAVVPSVACPVLCAWAVRDGFVSLARSLPAIGRFPDARVVRFDAGHTPHLETPEEFEAALEAFLAGLPEEAAAGRGALSSTARLG